MYIPNLNFSAQFGWMVWEKQSFLEVKKGKTHHIPYVLLIDVEGCFLDMLYNFEFSINRLKKAQFLRLWPLNTPSRRLEPYQKNFRDYEWVQ